MSDSSTRKSASKPVYHSVSRTRTESSMVVISHFRIAYAAIRRRTFRFLRFVLRRFPGHAEKVSSSSSSVQQRLTRVRINFSPQAVYVHFDQVRKRVEALVPHVLRNFRAPNHPSRVARQKLQQ